MTRPSHGAKPIGATAFADRGGEDLGWIMAGELVSGDLLADIDGGQFVKVVSNALTETQETVYNFEVDSAHSYFVDELGLWAHNAGFGNNLSSPKPATLYKLIDDAGRTLKFGISNNPARRYTQAFLDANNCRLEPLRTGLRREIRELEKRLNRRFFDFLPFVKRP